MKMDACCIEAVNQGKDEREVQRPVIDALAPADDAVEQREDDEDDDERVIVTRNGTAKAIYLREADVGDGKAEERKEKQQSLVGDLLLEELVEEPGAA